MAYFSISTGRAGLLSTVTVLALLGLPETRGRVLT